MTETFSPPSDQVVTLVARGRAGDIRSVGRLLTLAEDHPQALAGAAVLTNLGVPMAHVIGITGPPGAGKSTTTGALVAELRRHGHRVGVLAVDPSSPFSGGALLGDRLRMQDHFDDEGVFIRSLASRGQLGGVSAVTPLAIRVLLATGHDRVVVETVGVGQSEVEIAQLADTTVVLTAPGLGDGVQAGKAGLLEVADVYVVNKADREGAGDVRRHLQSMISWGRASGPNDWRKPIVMTVATSGDGIEELADKIQRHLEWLQGTGAPGRSLSRARAELQAALLHPTNERLTQARVNGTFDELVRRIAVGELDPWAAAKELMT